VTSREFKDRLTRRARRADLTLTAQLIAALEQYYRLLAAWNAKINLTALPLGQPDDDTFDRLLVEPLVAARFLPAGPLSVVDIGSGSGSPAIPLALARPDLSLRMVESKTRKAVFLTEAARHLGLEHVTVEAARFEQLLSRPDLHEAADVVTIRAVRVESRTLLTLQAFLKTSGQLFWFRGPVGPDQPEAPPPLRWMVTHPLVDSLRSRLVVLGKDLVALR
jgi:16S rRNA (guanine527-N7)-methyltransferase